MVRQTTAIKNVPEIISLGYTNAAAERDIILVLIQSQCARVNLYLSCQMKTHMTSTILIFIDIDECNKTSHNCSLENRQMCINTEGSFECDCISGFNFVSENCEGILYMAVDQYPQPPPPLHTHS